MSTQDQSGFSFSDAKRIDIAKAKGKIKIHTWEGPGFALEVPARFRALLQNAIEQKSGPKGDRLVLTQPPGRMNMSVSHQEEGGSNFNNTISGCTIGTLSMGGSKNVVGSVNVGSAPAKLESIEITIVAPKGAEIRLLDVDGTVEIDGDIDGTLMIYAMAADSYVYCRGRMRDVIVTPWEEVYVGLSNVTDKLVVKDQGYRVRLALSHCETKEVELEVSNRSEILLDGTVTEKGTVTAEDTSSVLIPSFTGDPTQFTFKKSPSAKIKVNGREV